MSVWRQNIIGRWHQRLEKKLVILHWRCKKMLSMHHQRCQYAMLCARAPPSICGLHKLFKFEVYSFRPESHGDHGRPSRPPNDVGYWDAKLLKTSAAVFLEDRTLSCSNFRAKHWLYRWSITHCKSQKLKLMKGDGRLWWWSTTGNSTMVPVTAPLHHGTATSALEHQGEKA